MTKEIKSIIKVNKENSDQDVEICVQRDKNRRDFTLTVSLTINGVNYVGYGKNCDIDEPLADLQSRLPDGVFIKCCVTCQYGSFCPYGSDGDNMLCIFPETISDKLDLVDLMAKDKYIIKNFSDCCENFTPANDEAYSYNSFLHYLKG